MRKYIRHPIDIPLEFDIDEIDAGNHKMINVGDGGIAFFSSEKVPVGEIITIRIPPIDPSFKVQGRVVWCRDSKHGYDVGVAFLDDKRVFQARMVEQICYIEHYQKEVLLKEGRELTLEEASQEWIEKYAGMFPEDD